MLHIILKIKYITSHSRNCLISIQALGDIRESFCSMDAEEL